MTELNQSDKISRNPAVGFSRIDEDIVMMGPEDSHGFGLNPVAAEIWSLLETDPMTLDEICTKVRQRYAVDESTCLADVKRFVTEMVALKKLVVL